MKRSLFMCVATAAVLVGVTACAKKDEYKTSPSGIKYRIEKEGTGRKPNIGDRVEVHYTGWLDTDDKEGTKFDSSVDRGQPFMFNVGRGMVIKGWDESLQDMKEGEVRYIILPPDLAYGPRGMGGRIPPNSILRFRVEFIKIV